jgi:hypothetical protein
MNMKTVLSLCPLVLCFGAAGAWAQAASTPLPSASAPAAEFGKAAEACELAVTDDLRDVRGKGVQRIEFASAQRVMLPAAGKEISVKGAGKYWFGQSAPIPFTYRCAYHTPTGKTNGVVISDKGVPAASSAASKAWQPDMSRLSPEACETAMAETLKTKHPRVSRIAFGSDTRELKPATNGNTLMEGRGGVQPAPGMNAVAFSYRCEFDARTGQLVSAKISE